jgi:hypothetical protein
MKRDWKIRLDKITYGLIYPAFFGNMIYDILNIFLKKDLSIHFNYNHTLIIAILLIVFVVVDYMHLNADVNSIFKKAEFKSRAYFFCDILTPTFLFIAFVLLKNNNYFKYGIIGFALVPGIIWIYKKSNPKSKKYFMYYSIASILIGTALFIFQDLQTPLYIEFFILFSTITYTVYMLWYYPKKSRKYDLEYIEKLREQFLDNGCC